MRAQFLLIPAALVMAAPAGATIFMSQSQAQTLLFPGAAFTERFVRLNASQAAGITDDARVAVYDYQVKAWRVSGATSGWFILDQVQGKDDTITYAVALDDEGAVRGIEILECLADYNAVTMPKWRAQFIGQRAGELRYVPTISGSTLSSRHITDGVRRVLVTYNAVLKNL